jgi:membrane-bound serine protease (ClpP class)
VALALSALFAFLAYRFFERRGILRRIFLTDEARSELGFVATADYRDLEGLEGVTLTPLRPAGSARIGERRIDVVSEGEFIAAGVPVKVVLVEGSRVVVRKSDA